jgi:hypothetical protein
MKNGIVEPKVRVKYMPVDGEMSRKEERIINILLAALGVMIGLAVTYWVVLYAGGAL